MKKNFVTNFALIFIFFIELSPIVVIKPYFFYNNINFSDNTASISIF